MKRLESHVEAIVGPLRASERRKDRIREELLAHLEAASEAGSAEDALARFGSVDALRGEIQDSVPAAERWLFAPVSVGAPLDVLFVHDPQRDRTPARYAARRTVVLVSMLAVVVAVVLGAVSFRLPAPGVGAKLGDLARIAAALAGTTFATFYLLERTGIRPKLDLRDPCPASIHVFFLTAFIVLYAGSFLAAILLLIPDENSLVGWVASWRPRSMSALAGVVSLTLWFAWREARETKRRYARWGTPPHLARH